MALSTSHEWLGEKSSNLIHGTRKSAECDPISACTCISFLLVPPLDRCPLMQCELKGVDVTYDVRLRFAMVSARSTTVGGSAIGALAVQLGRKT